VSDQSDIAEAQSILEKDRQTRAERASQRILAILEEERCNLTAVPQLTPDGRITAIVQIVARRIE